MSVLTCPYEISLLVHFHAYAEDWPQAGTKFYSEIVDRWLGWNLIKPINESPYYRTTERGEMMIEMLLTTPLPELVWVDPRDVEVSK